ncbi:hypothetical protein IQ07DRAFT_592574 [Pyrenochaeta sp. DS3sAY3a]|nr:hypothetical protein IQ07DRAFT_592574 [Pyrenochaeta sp. DS3sAY3a]
MPSKNDKHADLELRNGDGNGSGSGNAKGTANEKQTKGLSKKDATDCTQHWEDPEHMKQNQEAYQKFQAANRRTTAAQQHAKDEDSKMQDVPEEKEEEEPQDDHDAPFPAPKRGHGANSASAPNKKQKTSNNGTDSAGAPKGKAGDKTRVPQEGEKVQWHALPGYVDGEVVEVVYEEKEVQGKKVKASKEDPRVVLRSEKSGKICVHKPEVVYF